MPECNLIIDYCCDLPPELIDREGIMLLKFPYIIDGETYEDDMFQTLKAKDFYDGMRRGAQPSTAQVPIPVFEKIFKEAIETGKPTVYLSFTSGMSGSFETAQLVRDKLVADHPGVELYLVDTLLASIAEGFLVYEAINQWERGMGAQELAQWAEEARYFVDCQFMVEDLQSLHRGGRIPGSVAVVGGALDVKPLLTIDAEGKLTLTGIARGRKKGIKQLVDYFEKNFECENCVTTVIIGNSDCSSDAHRLKDLLLKVDESALIIDSTIGPVIGSHVGPGMIAVCFWGKDKRQNLSMAGRIAKRVKGGK